MREKLGRGLCGPLVVILAQVLYSQEPGVPSLPFVAPMKIFMNDDQFMAGIARFQYSKDTRTLKRLKLSHQASECPAPYDLNVGVATGKESFHKCIVGQEWEADGLERVQEYEGEDYYYLPPYEPYSREAHSKFAIPSWAPIRKVVHGKAILREWESLANAGKLFGCGIRGLCNGYFNATWEGRYEGKPTHFRLLAQCNVQTIRGAKSVPLDCSVRVVYEKKTYIQVIGSWPKFSSTEQFNRWVSKIGVPLCDVAQCHFFNGRPDADIRIVGPFSSKRVLGAIAEALNTPPLSLQTEISPGAVIGQADQRASQILDPYHEWPFVRVDVGEISWAEWFDDTADSGRGPKRPPLNSTAWNVVVSTTLLVNRRPTRENLEWHPPTSQQNDKYVEAVKSEIIESLKKGCKEVTGNGYFQLICN